MEREKLYSVWLAEKGLHFKTVRRLLENLGSFEDVYRTRNYEGIVPTGSQEEMRLMNKALAEAETIVRIIERMGAGIMTILDPEYPKSLRMIVNPPVVLYTKGAIRNFNDIFCVGMVGTRRSSRYGQDAAIALSKGIAREGICVVSGLARGIDTWAAKGALAGNGPYIGVLGCGIDVVYPSENAQLFKEVQYQGAIITEYPPGTAPYGHHFPQRNRIIAGLCAGLIVVEAPKKSGALITAEYALNASRAVFAVPGNIFDSNFSGSNLLLRDGAQIVLDETDITGYFRHELKLFRLEHAIERPDRGAAQDKKSTYNAFDDPVDAEQELKKLNILNEEEKVIIKILMREKMHIDDIVRETKQNPGTVNAALFSLELAGVIQKLPGDFYEYISQS